MISDSIWDEVDEMPTTFEGKKALSESFLKRALRGLLIETSDRKVLQAPYGRPPQPTPLVNLTDFLKNGGLDEEEDCDDDEPVFSYDYGFDPLQYLADYLKFLHPHNIRRMKDERREIVNRLSFRASHARDVLNNFDELKILTQRLRSGVLWGPFTSPSTSSTPSSSAVVCACKVIRKGDLIVELSKDQNFRLVENSWTLTVKDENITQKITLSDLEPATKYFVRCCLKDTEPQSGPDMNTLKSRFQTQENNVVEEECKMFRGVEDGFFQFSQFISCPSEESENIFNPVENVKIVALNVSSVHMSLASLRRENKDDTDSCLVTCLLGGLFCAPAELSGALTRVGSSDEIDHSDFYNKKCFDLHRYSDSFAAPDSVLRNSSTLFAWHDRSFHSDFHLNEEEAAIKKYLQDHKKYEAKYGKGKGGKNRPRSLDGSIEIPPPPPRLKVPKLRSEFMQVLQTLPVEFEKMDKPMTQQLYSTCVMGTHVQLFVLDHRRGYLGKDQVVWLSDALASSTARFKILLSGTPFGASSKDPQKPSHVVSAADVDMYLNNDSSDSNSMALAAANAAALVKESIATGVAPPVVSMQVPPPIAALGCDEAGRQHLSLAAVIAAYQQTCMKRRMDNRRESGAGLDDPQTQTRDLAAMQQLQFESMKEPVLPLTSRRPFNYGGDQSIPVKSTMLEIEIESGLLVLSSGVCVPPCDYRAPVEPVSELVPVPLPAPVKRAMSGIRESSKEVPKRSSSPSPSVVLRAASEAGSLASGGVCRELFNEIDSTVTPFAATYNPRGAGKAFCLEVCVGGGEGVGGEVYPAPLPPAMLPSLGTDLLYTLPIPTPVPLESKQIAESYSAVATLTDSGFSLDLQLLALNPKQTHTIIFQCKMKVSR